MSNWRWPVDDEVKAQIGPAYFVDQIQELESEINRHHVDFENISTLCAQVRNGDLTAESAIKRIQNIVG